MKRYLLTILLIVIVTLSIYANTLWNGFVYDDVKIIVNNAFIKNFSNLTNLFNRDIYFVSTVELTYRPVVTFTYLLNYAIFDLKAYGFHLINICLHALNGILLYSFLIMLFKECKTSLIATMIFITHPVLTEAVNAISYREDLLAFLFYMAALNLFMVMRLQILSLLSWALYPLFCLSYLLALFSKEMAITLPLILFLYIQLYESKPNLRSVLSNRYLLCSIIITIFYLFLRFTYFYNPLEGITSSWHVSERFYSIPYLLLNYLRALFFPFALSAVYNFHPVTSPFSPLFILPVVAIIFILTVTINLRKNEADLKFCILFFFVTLLPIYNIIPISNPFAERYLYLPSVGFAMFASIIIKKNSRPVKYDFIIISVTIILTGLYSIGTIKRNYVWKDGMSFWMDTAKKSPDVPIVHNNLGVVYAERGLTDKAMEHFKIALKLNPEYPDAYNNLGRIYQNKELIEKAVECYKMSLRLRPDYPEAHNNLGILYQNEGLIDKAIEHFQIALKLNPYYPEPHNNLGVAYLNKGLIQKAVEHFDIALKLNPEFPEPRYNLKKILNKK